MKNISIKLPKGKIMLIGNNGGSRESCELIESIVSCDSAKLSQYGGSVELCIRKEDGTLNLKIKDGTSRLSDESKSIVVVKSENLKIRSCAYYGQDCDLDFVNRFEDYSLTNVHGHIKTLKNIISAWSCKKGSIASVILLIDRMEVFKELLKDEFFKSMFVLYLE